MGRKGITAEQVIGTATELQAQGINPTVDAVRAFLGTGSKSTIVSHLKVWRSEQVKDEIGILKQRLEKAEQDRLFLIQQKADLRAAVEKLEKDLMRG